MTFLCTREGALADGGPGPWPQPWAFRCDVCGRTLPYAVVLLANETRRTRDQARHVALDEHRCGDCEGRWVRDGLLRATRVPGYGREDRPFWQVLEPDLVAFLREHGHQVDRDEVDLAYRQFVPERWVTLVDAFKAGAAFPNLLEAAVKAGLIPEARKRGDLGTKWVIPARIVPALVEARRRMQSDADHRRLLGMYHRAAQTGNVKRRTRYLKHRAIATSDGGRKARAA